MKGYKVFDPDWTCRGFRYEVGKTYEEDIQPQCCKQGFHFCKNLIDCFNYYSFNPENKVAEIEALGEIDTKSDSLKCSTNKIKIVKELSWGEVLSLVNTGEGNSGKGNSGYCNSGDCNSGDCNSGNCNSGNCNSGNRNSGNRNSGYCNSGNRNSGHRNSGYCNSGDCNSGHRNSGDFNSGDYNSGDCNSGDFNSGNYNIGYFCTGTPNAVFFDKPTDIPQNKVYELKGIRIINSNLVMDEWIEQEQMTEEEKKEHPEHETTGGYLKVFEYKEAWGEMWDKLSDEDKAEICKLPNFDKDKFYEITGIKV